MDSFGFAWIHWVRPSGRRVHSGSRRFTCVLLNVAGFIRVRMGSLDRGKLSSRSFRFASVHTRANKGHGVHSGSRIFTCALLTVAGFIRIHVGLLVLS